MTPGIVGVFRKSSFSDQQGDCVEVARTASKGVAVRDSKTPSGPCLFFESDAWLPFVGVMKSGSLRR